MASNAAENDLSEVRLPDLPHQDGENNDWQLRKSVLECNQHMLENQIRCDVKFTFDSERHSTESDEETGGRERDTSPLSCHTYMLISRSPVFYAMLAGPVCEESDTIHIPDIERDTFQEMLRYSKNFYRSEQIYIP